MGVWCVVYSVVAGVLHKYDLLNLNKFWEKNMRKYFKLLQQTLHLLRQNSISCSYWAGPDMPGLYLYYSVFIAGQLSAEP
jgi:hypothetical protein